VAHLRIFISSVQKELVSERAALRDYLRGDALMRRFFDVFLFEDVPASAHRAEAVYLAEVERCDRRQPELQPESQPPTHFHPPMPSMNTAGHHQRYEIMARHHARVDNLHKSACELCR